MSSHGHHHAHDDKHAHVHRAASRRALSAALVVLAIFFVVELAGGLWTHSLALVSDAGHLLTDVGAIILALVAQWVARRPPSPARSYGYKRGEILAALFNGVTLWLVAVLIAIEAVRRFDDPPEVNSGAMVAIAAVGLVAQLGVSWLLSRARDESLNVEGAYLHALTDALQSVGVIVAGLLMMWTQLYWIDPVVSGVVAVLILWGGGRLVFEASHVLLEGTPREIDLQELLRVMQTFPGVLRVSDLHAWSLTTGDNALSAHIVSHDTLSAVDREELRCELDSTLRARFPVRHITLQVERVCRYGDGNSCCAWAEDGAMHDEGAA